MVSDEGALGTRVLIKIVATGLSGLVFFAASVMLAVTGIEPCPTKSITDLGTVTFAP